MLLIEQGHKIVLHARSAVRADEIRKTIAGAEEDIVVGDLGKHRGDEVRRATRSISSAVSMPSSTMPESVCKSKLVKTVDGLPQLFAVNTSGSVPSDVSHSRCRSGWCILSSGMQLTVPDRISTTCCGEKQTMERLGKPRRRNQVSRRAACHSRLHGGFPK